MHVSDCMSANFAWQARAGSCCILEMRLSNQCMVWLI